MEYTPLNILWRAKKDDNDVYPTWIHNDDSPDSHSIYLRKISRDSFLLRYRPTIQTTYRCVFISIAAWHSTHTRTPSCVNICIENQRRKSVWLHSTGFAGVFETNYLYVECREKRNRLHISNWHGTNLSYKMHLKSSNRLFFFKDFKICVVFFSIHFLSFFFKWSRELECVSLYNNIFVEMDVFVWNVNTIIECTVSKCFFIYAIYLKISINFKT